MRPKKLLLIHCTDPHQASLHKYKLENWGYLVVIAASIEELRSIDPDAVDATIEFAEGSPTDQLAARTTIRVPHALIERVLVGRLVPYELREALKVAIARKRGPRATNPAIQAAAPLEVRAS